MPEDTLALAALKLRQNMARLEETIAAIQREQKGAPDELGLFTLAVLRGVVDAAAMELRSVELRLQTMADLSGRLLDQQDGQ
jgi:hypothetical protein